LAFPGGNHDRETSRWHAPAPFGPREPACFGRGIRGLANDFAVGIATRGLVENEDGP